MPLVQQLPPTVVGAAVVDAGRGVFFGHEGFFVPDNIRLLDNEVVITNAASWLGRGNRRILFDRFSYETWGRGVHDGLVDLLGSSGYTISVATGNLSADQLANADILTIAARWEEFTPAELTAIEDFVRGQLPVEVPRRLVPARGEPTKLHQDVPPPMTS